MIRMPDMRRRAFLAGGTVLFGSLAARAIHGQPIPPNLRRCAVAIGIDSYEGPPSLRAAVKGANDMATSRPTASRYCASSVPVGAAPRFSAPKCLRPLADWFGTATSASS